MSVFQAALQCQLALPVDHQKNVLRDYYYYYYVYSVKLYFQNFPKSKAGIFSEFVVSNHSSRTIMHNGGQGKGHLWKSLQVGNGKKYPLTEV